MNKWCRLDAILIDLHASYIPVSKYLTTIVSEFLLDDLVGNISIKIRSEVKHIPPHTDVIFVSRGFVKKCQNVPKIVSENVGNPKMKILHTMTSMQLGQRDKILLNLSVVIVDIQLFRNILCFVNAAASTR